MNAELAHHPEARDRLGRLWAAIALGGAEYSRGEGEEWTAELMDRLEREANENARLGRPIDDAVTP